MVGERHLSADSGAAMRQNEQHFLSLTPLLHFSSVQKSQVCNLDAKNTAFESEIPVGEQWYHHYLQWH